MKINSSMIESCDYDPMTGTLTVTMHGTVYRYLDVPADVAQGLETVESAGRYFGQHIKGKYQFEKG